MHDLPIELLGSSVLRTKADAVEIFDDSLREFIQAMFRTMYRANGQGLAAPQVGVAKRIVVIDLPSEDSPAFALINPRITSFSAEKARVWEGCLSIPGVSARVTRPCGVIVEARDPSGMPLRIEASGELAHCMQHEIDHLNGVLYIDHLSFLERQLAVKRYEKLHRKKRA